MITNVGQYESLQEIKQTMIDVPKCINGVAADIQRASNPPQSLLKGTLSIQ